MNPRHALLLRRPWAVWLAVLIALFGALSPTLSHALAQPRGGNGAWTEVCTSTGTRWVATPNVFSTETPAGSGSVLTLEHCPFCLLFTDRAAPPAHSLAHFFQVLGDPGVPTVWQAFFFSNPVAVMPPARGPPNTNRY